MKISVVVTTFNRAEYLRLTLQSFVDQTVSPGRYEMIVIDDGSTDNTKDIVKSFGDSLPLRYVHQDNSGLASAKNRGFEECRNEIVLFLDDDDFASRNLLEEHLRAHEDHPAPNYSVLNYTSWANNLKETVFMYFITKVGCYYSCYPYIKHGDVLGFDYFWGGRTSMKREFLRDNGLFNPVFRFGCEDIELGYRLSKAGLKVVYNANAVSYMARDLKLDDFCNRLIKQGRSQFLFSSMHDDPVVYKWCEIDGSEKVWEEIKNGFGKLLASTRSLDKIAQMKTDLGLGIDPSTERILYHNYHLLFRACKARGIIEARDTAQSISHAGTDRA